MFNFFLENTRRDLFWIIDELKGGKIKQAYNEVKFINENADSEKAKEINRQNLINLLNHAVATTPFYKAFHDFKGLNDFPVVNKLHYKNELRQFLSSAYAGKKLHKETTSGSTGTPLTVFQDKGKRIRHIAENIYFSEIIGFKLGTRLYYLRVWNELNKKSRLKSWMQNIVMQNTASLSDESWKIFFDKLQKDKSDKSILSYALTLAPFGRYLTANNISFEPGFVKSVILISEAIPYYSKEQLKKAFNCPVISRYSNMENGFMAQECIKDNNEYHLNLTSFHFELLHPDKDEPVKHGELGRIIVTDLFNYAMPIIRYDTGDLAVFSSKSNCGAPGPVLTKVEGRRCDCLYDTKDKLISSAVITNSMWKYADEIIQFQFIQEGHNHYLLKLNCGKHAFNQQQELLADLKEYIGKDAQIKIKFVDEIPRLSSGKRKQIMNKYKPG